MVLDELHSLVTFKRAATSYRRRPACTGGPLPARASACAGERYLDGPESCGFGVRRFDDSPEGLAQRSLHQSDVLGGRPVGRRFAQSWVVLLQEADQDKCARGLAPDASRRVTHLGGCRLLQIR